MWSGVDLPASISSPFGFGELVELGEGGAFGCGLIGHLCAGVGAGEVEVDLGAAWAQPPGGLELAQRGCVVSGFERSATEEVVGLGRLGGESEGVARGVEGVCRLVLAQSDGGEADPGEFGCRRDEDFGAHLGGCFGELGEGEEGGSAGIVQKRSGGVFVDQVPELREGLVVATITEQEGDLAGGTDQGSVRAVGGAGEFGPVQEGEAERVLEISGRGVCGIVRADGRRDRSLLRGGAGWPGCSGRWRWLWECR